MTVQRQWCVVVDGMAGGVSVRLSKDLTHQSPLWTLEIDGEVVPIFRVSIFRDGGTQHVKTAVGTLVIPQAMIRPEGRDLRPSWRGVKVEAHRR